jgi:hypothetical protein
VQPGEDVLGSVELAHDEGDVVDVELGVPVGDRTEVAVRGREGRSGDPADPGKPAGECLALIMCGG